MESGHKKMSQTSDRMNTDNPKGDYSKVTIDIGYRRSWIYQGMGVSEALNIIWEAMLRWPRHKLMRYYCRVLSWSLSAWRSVGTSIWVKDLEGTYVWVGK